MPRNAKIEKLGVQLLHMPIVGNNVSGVSYEMRQKHTVGIVSHRMNIVKHTSSTSIKSTLHLLVS